METVTVLWFVYCTYTGFWITPAQSNECTNVAVFTRNEDNCPSHNQIELCRWENVDNKWGESSVNGETFMTASMNGMSETSMPVKLMSSRLCPAGRDLYQFMFQYFLANTSNCELTTFMNTDQARHVLWNSSSGHLAGSTQTVTLTNATCSDCEFQIVFEGRKRNRHSCNTINVNAIGINKMGYVPLDSAATSTTLMLTTPPPPPPTTTTKITTLRTTMTMSTSALPPSIMTTQSIRTISSTIEKSDESSPLSSLTTVSSSSGTFGTASRPSVSSTDSVLKNSTAAVSHVESDDEDGLNGGAVAGIVFGIVVAAVVLIVIVVFLRRGNTENAKLCFLISKFVHPKQTKAVRTGTTSAHSAEDKSTRVGSRSAVAANAGGDDSVYELAYLSHEPRDPVLSDGYPPTDEAGYQTPVPSPPQHRRHGEDSHYDFANDEEAGNYYSTPDDTCFGQSLSMGGNSVYELASGPDMGHNLGVSHEDAYNELSHIDQKHAATPLRVGGQTNQYSHLEEGRRKPAMDKKSLSEYSLACAVGEPNSQYNHLGEDKMKSPKPRTTRDVYSLACADEASDTQYNHLQERQVETPGDTNGNVYNLVHLYDNQSDQYDRLRESKQVPTTERYENE